MTIQNQKLDTKTQDGKYRANILLHIKKYIKKTVRFKESCILQYSIKMIYLILYLHNLMYNIILQQFSIIGDFQI